MSVIDFLLKNLNIGAESEAVYTTSTIILSMSCILLIGFFLTRLTKKLRLPNVSAYIIAGIIIGPSVLHIIPESFVTGTDFLNDIALAFIAFSAGEFFKVDALKKAGSKAVIITLFESLMTFVFVFVMCGFVLRINLTFSLVLAALSSATAPASTLMTIRQLGAKGDYVNILLEVVALDDVITLLLYSISISICTSLTSSSGVSFVSFVFPLLKTVICLVVGGLCGFLLMLLLPKNRTADNRLIIVIAVLLAFCGFCILMDQSPLLGCMAMGAIYINETNDDKLFSQLNYFSPPVLLLFFVRSGMNFKFSSLASASAVGAIPLVVVVFIYFFVRIAGKYTGAFTGALVTKCEPRVRNYIGLGLIPQAGVAIGLAATGARTFISNGLPELGMALNTIILASSILYELVGPASSKLGLYLSKSYSNNIDEVVSDDEVSGDSQANKLIEKIQIIHKRVIEENSRDEEIYTKAAEEYREDRYV